MVDAFTCQPKVLLPTKVTLKNYFFINRDTGRFNYLVPYAPKKAEATGAVYATPLMVKPFGKFLTTSVLAPVKAGEPACK